MSNPSQLWFTIARATKIGATKIHHKCGYCATIFQIAAVARLIDRTIAHITRTKAFLDSTPVPLERPRARRNPDRP
jgi:hypothetical protein